METKEFNSSQVASGTYDKDSFILTISFKTGAEYQYMGVPQNVWDGLCAAESAGKYINSHIKGKFLYEKIK